MDFIHAHLTQGRFAPPRSPAFQVPQIYCPDRALRQSKLARYSPRCRAFTCHAHCILKPLGKGRLAWQHQYFLPLDSAIWALHPKHLDVHSRAEFAPRQITHGALPDIVDPPYLPSASGTFHVPIAPLPPHPQLQCLGFLVNLVLVDPVSGPHQNPGVLFVRRQSPSLAEPLLIQSPHEFLLRAEQGEHPCSQSLLFLSPSPSSLSCHTRLRPAK